MDKFTKREAALFRSKINRRFEKEIQGTNDMKDEFSLEKEKETKKLYNTYLTNYKRKEKARDEKKEYFGKLMEIEPE
jgi:hypothetical protein